jgi:Post-segregation antitoxin CcdA
MRMARVNITVPDEVIIRAREAKLNISRITTAALVEELNRLVKRTELDAYLAELEAERGPITEEEAAEGRAWLDACPHRPASIWPASWRGMTAVILDSGGITGLLRRPERLQTLSADRLWPAHVPAVVLTEILTGDDRRDFHVDRLLKLWQIGA